MSNPPLVGVIFRPNENVRREILMITLLKKYYTLNHINSKINENKLDIAKFTKQISEFKV